MVTQYDKAFVAAIVGILFWFVSAAQTGDWTNTDGLEALLVTALVYFVPNKGAGS